MDAEPQSYRKSPDYSANNGMKMIVHHIINSFGQVKPSQNRNNSHQQKNQQKRGARDMIIKKIMYG